MWQAYRFALDPAAAPQRVLASHCGGARKAFNEGLAQVKRCLDQRGAERSYGVPGGLLTEVRGHRRRSPLVECQGKEVLAPWWAQNSKEAYNSGLRHASPAGCSSTRPHAPASAAGRRPGSPGSSRGTGPGCRAGSPQARSGSMMACMWCCHGSGKSIRTERTTALLARIDAGTAQILAATESASTGAAGTVRSPSGPIANSAAPLMILLAGRGTRWPASILGCGTCSWSPPPMAHWSPGFPRRDSLAGAQGRLGALQRRAARQAGPDRRTGQRPSQRWRGLRRGSGGSTPGPRTCAGMRCTRPPRSLPSTTT